MHQGDVYEAREQEQVPGPRRPGEAEWDRFDWQPCWVQAGEEISHHAAVRTHTYSNIWR